MVNVSNIDLTYELLGALLVSAYATHNTVLFCTKQLASCHSANATPVTVLLLHLC